MQSFVFEEDRQRYLAAHWLKRKILGVLRNVEGQALRFGSLEYGKPALLGERLHFNLSHSGDWVAVAVCGHTPVGVDIEQACSMKPDAAMPQIMHPLDHISALCETPEERFLAAWTLKEAIAKCSGEGLGIPFESMHVRFREEGEYIGSCDGCRTWYAHHRHAEGIHLAVACTEPWKSLRMVQIGIPERMEHPGVPTELSLSQNKSEVSVRSSATIIRTI